MKKSKLKKQVKILIILIILVLLIILLNLIITRTKSTPLPIIDDATKSTTVTTTKEIEKPKEVKLTLVGDLLFEQPFYNAVDKGYDKTIYFNRIKSYFQDDDLSIGNMEVVIGNDKIKPSGTGFNFCAPEYIGDLVNTLDFQVLSTANNHAYDRDFEGIKSSIDYFKNKTNIKTVGTNYNGIDEDLIIEKNGIKFGIMAYTYGTNQKPSNENRKYINYFRNIDTKTVTNENKENIKNKINSLKEKADVLIAIMHWGKEFQYTTTKEQRDMAKFLNEEGIDIILGSHSHCIEPIEELVSSTNHKTLVYYSMGNFVSADDDISRTPKGQETFDNAYQVGLLSTLKVTKNKNTIEISDIKTTPIVNYFDKKMNNFELIPFSEYSEEYEKNHYRYSYGLTSKFITDMYETVIDKKYR